MQFTLCSLTAFTLFMGSAIATAIPAPEGGATYFTMRGQYAKGCGGANQFVAESSYTDSAPCRGTLGHTFSISTDAYGGCKPGQIGFKLFSNGNCSGKELKTMTNISRGTCTDISAGNNQYIGSVQGVCYAST